MKKSKFKDAQIAFILRQAEEETAVAEVCRKVGILEATFYTWRKRYGGMMQSEVNRFAPDGGRDDVVALCTSSSGCPLRARSDRNLCSEARQERLLTVDLTNLVEVACYPP